MRTKTIIPIGSNPIIIPIYFTEVAVMALKHAAQLANFFNKEIALLQLQSLA
jgi:hypothetical protein